MCSPCCTVAYYIGYVCECRKRRQFFLVCVELNPGMSDGMYKLLFLMLLCVCLVYIGSAYLYNLPTELGRQYFGPQYDGVPDLVLDAQKAGNISRFINDNNFRSGEDENGEGSTSNIDVCWLFHGVPMIALYAVRPINKGIV